MLSCSVFAIVATAAVLLLLAPTSADETPLRQPEPYQQRLVDWIRSGKNGFFHPQVQWQRLGGTGPYAMHTAVDMPKGTKLLVVPRSHVIDSLKTHNECVTVARMLDEYEKGDDSFYAPYLSYLFDDTTGGTSSGLLPASWSEEGQELLEFILNSSADDDSDMSLHLEPLEYEKPSVFERCEEYFRADMREEELTDKDDRQRAEDAWLFYISRSWTDKMVPVLDMYNHRNGKSLNVESTSAHNDKDITAFALRDIKAGEQLQNTYSECMDYDCEFGRIKYTYDTATIYNDYGFLEFHPRRWKLGVDEDTVMTEVDEDLETGEKSFRWIFQQPSEQLLKWIDTQLKRLRRIEETVREAVAEHRNTEGEPHNNIEHEADSLLELFEGYKEVFEMALEHKDDPVGVTVEQFRKDLAEARQAVGLAGEL